ncbi:MAG: teichoic acid ABC transporter ATP-binding protein [Bacteroidetes bacterium]|nr:MAG: teichoic acid ABC transporter ATP-binding protein [Bacteroidota bacterium]
MQTPIAIRAENISKTFHISEDSHNTVKHRLFNLFNPPRRRQLEAVKPMSFEIGKGECIGLIGRNGCGKSTLVKLLAGVYPATTGKIETNGTTLLLQLGIGMSHELTARENIYVSSSVLGLRVKEIDAIFESIVEFAELREFVDTKIKYFSSGMAARLGFSIAVNAGADIMFLDEIFAVGDLKFQEKAEAVLESSWIRGRTVIMVSHTMSTIEKYCHRTAYLSQGNLVFLGDTTEAIRLYLRDNEQLAPPGEGSLSGPPAMFARR